MPNLTDLLGAKRYAPLYFMRHGQTQHNTQGVIRSWGNIGLDATGKKQAAHMAQLLRGKGVDCVYVSPLARNKQTGDIIAKALGCELEVREDLKTWKLPYAGQKVSEIKDELNYYQNHPDKTPPDGESYNSFYARALAFFKDQIGDAGKEPQEGILVIGNGRHSWALKRILSDIKTGTVSTKPVLSGGEPYPGSLLKIELPALTITPVYLSPAGESQSL